MYRKYIPILVLILAVFLFVLAGCSYIAYKDYYSDVDDYEKIWSLSGFCPGYEDVSPFFPESIDELDVKEFVCRYDQQLPLGEGVQLFLKIQYADKAMFDTELEKISAMSFDCSQCFEESALSAYATRLGEHFASEYALIDEKQQVIYYIYIQNLPKTEIEFDHRFLPKGYKDYGEVVTEDETA